MVRCDVFSCIYNNGYGECTAHPESIHIGEDSQCQSFEHRTADMEE